MANKKSSKKPKHDPTVVDALSRVCKSCQMCCKDVAVYTSYKKNDKEAIDFYRLRGFEIETDGEWVLLVLRNFPCPHLNSEGCTIYNHRPKVCRTYSGWKEQPGCKFDEIEKIITS